jgi:hypothetical protein
MKIDHACLAIIMNETEFAVKYQEFSRISFVNTFLLENNQTSIIQTYSKKMNIRMLVGIINMKFYGVV